MNEPPSDSVAVCARPGCTRPLDPENAVVYVHATGSLMAHPTCARAAASELGALALAAVNRARHDGLATRVDAMERRFEQRTGLSKKEWLEAQQREIDTG